MGEDVRREKRSPELLPGTLDLLILRTLATGPKHGYGIAERLRQVSKGVLHRNNASRRIARLAHGFAQLRA